MINLSIFPPVVRWLWLDGYFLAICVLFITDMDFNMQKHEALCTTVFLNVVRVDCRENRIWWFVSLFNPAGWLLGSDGPISVSANRNDAWCWSWYALSLASFFLIKKGRLTEFIVCNSWTHWCDICRTYKHDHSVRNCNIANEQTAHEGVASWRWHAHPMRPKTKNLHDMRNSDFMLRTC